MDLCVGVDIKILRIRFVSVWFFVSSEPLKCQNKVTSALQKRMPNDGKAIEIHDILTMWRAALAVLCWKYVWCVGLACLWKRKNEKKTKLDERKNNFLSKKKYSHGLFKSNGTTKMMENVCWHDLFFVSWLQYYCTKNNELFISRWWRKVWWFISNGIQFSVVFFSLPLAIFLFRAHTHIFVILFFYVRWSYLSTFESKKLSLILIVKDGHTCWHVKITCLKNFDSEKSLNSAAQLCTARPSTKEWCYKTSACAFFILPSSSCVFKCNESARVRDKHTWMLLFQLLSLIKFFCYFFFSLPLFAIINAETLLSVFQPFNSSY